MVPIVLVFNLEFSSLIQNASSIEKQSNPEIADERVQTFPYQRNV